MKKKSIWIIAGIVAVIAIAAYLLSGGKKEETISFDTVKVEKQNIQTTITATGTIEPVTSRPTTIGVVLGWSAESKHSLVPINLGSNLGLQVVFLKTSLVSFTNFLP